MKVGWLAHIFRPSRLGCILGGNVVDCGTIGVCSLARWLGVGRGCSCLVLLLLPLVLVGHIEREGGGKNC